MPTLGSENRFPLVRLLTDDPPSAAPAGQVHLFADTDKLLYSIDEDGIIEGPFEAAGTAGAVATDAIWDAAGDLVVGTGANTAARLAAGTNGHVLTLAAGTPSWVAPSGGGGLVLLEQHTAAASATLDFTSFISSTYDMYEFRLLNILSATDGTSLTVRVGTGGGPSWISTTSYSASSYEYRAGGAAAGGNESGQTAMTITRNGLENTGSASTLNGRLTLYNPSNASQYKAINGEVSYLGTVGGAFRIHSMFQGEYQATTAVTGLQFLMASGNITSGTIRVYGLEK